jgi:hypothetical protein
MDGVFWAVTLTACLCLREIPIRQPGADAQACDLELSLAVLKIVQRLSGGSSFMARDFRIGRQKRP